MKDPVKVLPIVKKIIPKDSVKKDHLFLYNVIDKKDFLAYLNKRYKNMSFVTKIMRQFFPSKDKLKYLEYFGIINQMLKWTRSEQIGFTFHLLDSNNDGLICIHDMFHLMEKLKDED